jgi:hypothetical protein
MKPGTAGDVPVPQCQAATTSPIASTAALGAPTFCRTLDRVLIRLHRGEPSARWRARTT